VVWLTFTSRGSGDPASEVFVHEVRPTSSKRDTTFRVLVHLDQMEDCSMAPLDFFGSSNDACAIKPTPVSFDWHYLTVDGMPHVPLQNEDDEEVLLAVIDGETTTTIHGLSTAAVVTRTMTTMRRRRAA
jgi:hypothetical protein